MFLLSKKNNYHSIILITTPTPLIRSSGNMNEDTFCGSNSVILILAFLSDDG